MNSAMLAAALVLTATALFPATFAQFQSGGVDKEGEWHVGENLKAGDYFSYNLCHIDYKECDEFHIQVWFKELIQVDSEEQWFVETVVEDGSKTVVGSMTLGRLTVEPTGSSEDLNKYRDAFKRSVLWLSAFATNSGGDNEKGPKAFSDVSWGKIANIGGEQIIPSAIEDVTVPAGTWEDAVVISWRTGGYTSKVWVVDEFPFPVEAHTFTHVSEGIPPPEYIFALQRYDNLAESPFEGVSSTVEEQRAAGCETDIQRTGLIKKATEAFKYQVHVSYGPEDPVEGCDMTWVIKFIKKEDETEILNRVQFDILVLDDEGRITRTLAGEAGDRVLYSPTGIYPLDLQIKEPAGEANYTILIYGLAEKWSLTPAGELDYLTIPITIFPSSDPPDPGQDVPSVPEWIKNTAGFWVEGSIDDSTFVSAMQFLIREGIIHVPPTDSNADPSAGSVPEWIKNTAGFWVEGSIDDSTFVSAMQFLIREGIIDLG